MRHYSLVILLATLSILASCEPEPHELRLVAPISQVDRPIAEDLGRLLDNEYATRITLSDSSIAGNAALDAVASGEADLALVANTQPFREDIATVMPLYSTILHIAYRDGRDASSGQTLLHDAKVYAGPEGSASQVLFARVVQRIGLDVASFEYVTDADTPPDVVVVFAPISQDLFTDYPDFRLFNLGPIVDVATLLNPHFRPIEIPAGTYGAATPENAVTLAVDKLLVTRNTLDSSVVYDLINDILRLRPALAAQRPGLFQQLTENFDASRSRFALHAGTQAYLQRSAPTVYERYSGVAEVIVTLMVALGSALIAGVRIFRMRRKNRIDRFYSAAIDVRKSLSDNMRSVEREQAISKLRELQNEAFDLLVHEKLAADESFQIFMTLSDDVLRELEANT